MTSHPLHIEALGLSGDLKRTEKRLILVIGEIDKLKVWRQMGYPSLFEYSVQALGLSSAQTYTLTSVSRKCQEVPELRTAVLTDKVSISNAKRIVPVLTSKSQNTRRHKTHCP
jgi:hypothetical protein